MSTYEEPLKIIVARPMGDSKVANYIIPGYLAPKEEIFFPLTRRMVGGVYIVSYKERFCRVQLIAKQLRQVLKRHDSDVTVRIFGFSLGANIACWAGWLPLAWNNPVEIYAICPLLHHRTIKWKLLLKTRLLVMGGRVLAVIMRRRHWGTPLVRMYGEPRSLVEMLSGAEEITRAEAPFSDITAKLWVLFARDDQYLDAAETRRYAQKISKNAQFLEVEMQHCWRVEVAPLERRTKQRVELTQKMDKLLSQLAWNTPAFSDV